MGLAGHRLAHAEINALLSVDHAAINLRECVLYTTLEPCALCVGAIRMLHISQVRYAARDPVAGGLRLLEATPFMRQGLVEAKTPGLAELENDPRGDARGCAALSGAAQTGARRC
jgi:tRNA(Arg) A34 adenosine deaminase TadA